MTDQDLIYYASTNGTPKPTSPERIKRWLADPPPWRARRVDDDDLIERVFSKSDANVKRDLNRGKTYVCSGDDERDHVNLALLLRRPLLVRGDPGLGKSSLAYAIAYALGLGPVLRWEINSQSTLADGLYKYDAVGHFHAGKDALISKFLTLGPLGTALLPTPRPRVLLIDELDKSSFDLPNDLLHAFEEGAFTIPELHRGDHEEAQSCELRPVDCFAPEDVVTVRDARVSTLHHPVMVITSNDERDFSPAFLRRCVQLTMKRLTDDKLESVVRSQFGKAGEDLAKRLEGLSGERTDVVLQALFADRLGFDRALLLKILNNKG